MDATNVYLDANAGIALSHSVIERISDIGRHTNPSNTLTRSGSTAAAAYGTSEKEILELLTEQPSSWKLVLTSGATEGIITSITNLAHCHCGSILCVDGHHPCIDSIREQWSRLHSGRISIDTCSTSELDLECLLRCRTNSSSPLDLGWSGSGEEATEYGSIFITHVISLSGEVVNCGALSSCFHRYSPDGIVVVDGTQAVGKIPFSIESTGADVYLLSGHKLGSLKGVGAMVLKRHLLPCWAPLVPGTQQEGLRGGTLNVQGIMSLSLALHSSLLELGDRIQKTKETTKKICEQLSKAALPRVRILSPRPGMETTGNTVLLSVPVCSSRLASSLAEKGYDVGIGTACQTDSNSVRSSAILPSETMGKDRFLIRISMVPGQSLDVDGFVSSFVSAFTEVISSTLSSLRK